MPQASPQQHSFVSGELSPLLYGRQDSERYVSGLAECRGFIPLVQGPVTRYPGFVRATTTKFPDRKARLIEFQFSVEQAYILEFGHQYIRFFSEGGFVSNIDRPIEDVTLGATTVVASTSHGFSDGDRVYLSGAGLEVDVAALAEREVIVANATADTFEVHDLFGNPIDTSGFTKVNPSTTGTASAIFELATSLTEDDLPDLRVVQSADVLYIFHPQLQPRKLLRTAEFTWELRTLEFQDGPWGPINTSDTTLELDGTGETVTITASSTAGINGTDGFLDTDVGRLIRWLDSNNEWTWLQITNRVSPLVVEATRYGQQPSSTTATRDWRLGLWSDTTGWPATGTFYEDRLALGGAPTFPMRVDFSRTSDYENFSPSDPDGTVADDHAVGVVMSSGEVNDVRWLAASSKGLLVGTGGGEWLVRASSINEPLTPANISARKSTAHGSAKVPPIQVGNATLFVDRAGRKLREMAYVFELDGYRAPDMSVLSEHLTRPDIATQMVFQRQPYPVVWMVRGDGELVGMTYDRGQGVVAWHSRAVGGELESLAVIPDPTGAYDEVYAIIKRGDYRYVEFMAKPWEEGDDQVDAFYVDGGVVEVSAGGTDTVATLWSLEGETVAAWADGGYAGEFAVENAQITLPAAASVIAVGLPFSSSGLLLPAEAGAADGSAQGKTKQIGKVGFWLQDTADLWYGSDDAHLTRLLTADWGSDYGDPPEAFTGVVRRRFEGDHELLGQILFKVDSPAPVTVLSVMYQLKTQDES